MSNLLSVSTLILCIAGALYSAVYLWLNSFYRTAESPRKNVGILRIIKSSVIWSMVFAFLSCLLAGGGAAYAAVDRASALYRVIALTWLALHPRTECVRFDVVALNIYAPLRAKVRLMPSAFEWDD